jgi:hypothetical protein
MADSDIIVSLHLVVSFHFYALDIFDLKWFPAMSTKSLELCFKIAIIAIGTIYGTIS